MKKSLYLIGICGRGMQWVAEIGLKLGYVVEGSDGNITLCSKLQTLGIPIHTSIKEDRIRNAHLVIYTSAVSHNHPELRIARNAGIATLGRAEGLALLLKEARQYIIAVAGSHGKSTLTAMLGLIFMEAGLDPTVGVGGYVPEFAGNAHIGNGTYAIIEACEYQRAFYHLGGGSGIITGLELEHLDTYPGGMPEIIDAFAHFAALLNNHGMLVVCADDVHVRRVVTGYSGRVVTYGLDRGDYRGYARMVSAQKSVFSAWYKQIFLGDFYLEVPGRHNIENALGALACAHSYGVSTKDITYALERFRGVEGRFERIYKNKQITVIYDIAHTPEKIKACIDTALVVFPRCTIVCVIGINTIHRTVRFLPEFAEQFSRVDACMVAPILPGLGDGGAQHAINARLLAQAINKAGGNATAYNNPEEVAQAVLTERNGSDHTVAMSIGLGHAKKIAYSIKENLEDKNK